MVILVVVVDHLDILTNLDKIDNDASQSVKMRRVEFCNLHAKIRKLRFGIQKQSARTQPVTWIGCMGSGSTIRLGFLYFRQGGILQGLEHGVSCTRPEVWSHLHSKT